MVRLTDRPDRTLDVYRGRNVKQQINKKCLLRVICPNSYTFRKVFILSGPEVINLFSCSTQLSMKFFLLINVKMPKNVGILTYMSGKNSILGLSESKNC